MHEYEGFCVDMGKLHTLVVKGGISIRDAVHRLATPYDCVTKDFHYSDVFQRIEAYSLETMIANVESIGIERFGLGRDV